jgi:hypothetical protein
VKSSPTYVLEEHSHCEVPAGCGGVVLRWRDRFTAIPVDLAGTVIGAESWETRIDGQELASARPLFPPGLHVVVIAVRGVVAGEFAFLVWATSPDAGEVPLLRTPGPWRAHGSEPDPVAWSDPDFDVSSWSECVPTEVADTKETPYSVRRLRTLGAGPLSVEPSILDGAAPRVWLRAVLDLPAAR